MKYCSNCGQILNDDAAFCTNCGTSCNTQNNYLNTYGNQVNSNGFNNNSNFNSYTNELHDKSSMNLAIQILMIISIVLRSLFVLECLIVMIVLPIFGIFLLLFAVSSLCLSIYFLNKFLKSVKYKFKLSTGFKVCNLILNDIISGILLLCDNN